MKVTSVLAIIAIAAVGLYAYDRVKAGQSAEAAELAKPVARAAPTASQFDPPWGQQPDTARPAERSPAYTCDGRMHCSQMRSCEEAKYFIRNCPNTKMDGDRDGIPCEDQWCG